VWNYEFPKPIVLKPVKKTVYISRTPGTLVYNCDPKKATETKKITVVRSIHWPLSVFCKIAGPKDRLLDVLFYCGYVFHQAHSIKIWWRGWRGHSCPNKPLFSFRLPYRWWTWKVLTRSKKLVWKTKTMWAKRASFPPVTIM